MVARSRRSPEMDPKAIARAMFGSPDGQIDAVEIGRRYSTTAADVDRVLLDAVRPERPGSRICELGFGTGWLLQEILVAYPEAELSGLDMSAAMTSRARGLFDARLTLATGDMERLPFAETVFDVVVTCWTLYFLRDIDAGLSQIKQALRPGGRLVVADNAPDHMLEFRHLSRMALRSILDRDEEPGLGARFDLESGSGYMRRHFGEVDVREWRGWLVVPDPAPVIRLWDLWRPASLAGEQGDRVRAEFIRLAEEWVEREGEIRIRHHGGALVGRRRPGQATNRRSRPQQPRPAGPGDSQPRPGHHHEPHQEQRPLEIRRPDVRYRVQAIRRGVQRVGHERVQYDDDAGGADGGVCPAQPPANALVRSQDGRCSAHAHHRGDERRGQHRTPPRERDEEEHIPVQR